MLVDETTFTEVHAMPPTFTDAPAKKPVPEIVIVVPPTTLPLLGLTPVTVGGALYEYRLVPVPLIVFVFVTTTLAEPADPAGVVQVMLVADTTTTDVHAEPPTVTVAPASKLEPVIVMLVPPAIGPPDGLTLETVGVTA